MLSLQQSSPMHSLAYCSMYTILPLFRLYIVHLNYIAYTMDSWSRDPLLIYNNTREMTTNYCTVLLHCVYAQSKEEEEATISNWWMDWNFSCFRRMVSRSLHSEWIQWACTSWTPGRPFKSFSMDFVDKFLNYYKTKSTAAASADTTDRQTDCLV